jgi:AAA domain
LERRRAPSRPVTPFDTPEERVHAAGGTTEAFKTSALRGTPYGRLCVLGIADIDHVPTRDYLLKGIISPAEISLWVGPPKCGKSFLLLHIAYLLSLGRSVFGRRAKTARVLYVAAEGEGGIANRIRALRDRHGLSTGFHFIAQPADLLHREGHLDDLIAAAKGCGAQLIVLDTLSRLMAGGDENSPMDMGTFIANVTCLRHETKAHIAIIHHGTKASNGSRPRGHSSLTGADDALIEVMKQADGTRFATVVHAKDDADGDRHGFQLDRADLGTDADGDPITTLTVTELADPPPRVPPPTKLTDNEDIALLCLDQSLKADGVLATVGEDFEERKVTTAACWKTWFYRSGMPDEAADTRLKAFKRARDGLISKKRVGSWDDFVWRPEVW